jgi:16S rRNA (guanine966-N2)-methyltransferase
LCLKKSHSTLLIAHLALVYIKGPNHAPRALTGVFSDTTVTIQMVLTGPDKKRSVIRIIAGQWRGSRIDVPDIDGLRPTPDRVRETLFNWLAADIPSATVLDCFAGAGGLGLEAASREAKRVIMVDVNRKVTANLKAQADRLGAQNVEIHTGSVLVYLDSCRQAFDIVFIDPPYAQPDLRQATLDKLIERHLLKPGALIYLEWPPQQEMPLTDPELHWVKQKTAGQVTYAIAQWRL